MDVKLQERLIAEARQRIMDDQEYVRDAQQEIAEYLCPFEVGERVINADGKREIIARIFYCSWMQLRYDFKVYKFKNNGASYVNSSRAYSIEKYKKADE